MGPGLGCTGVSAWVVCKRGLKRGFQFGCIDGTGFGPGSWVWILRGPGFVFRGVPGLICTEGVPILVAEGILA